MSEASLRLVEIDSETGEVAGDGCARCRDIEIDDYANLEKENRKLLRKINSLERDREQARQSDSNRSKILGIIELWKVETGHLRSNAHSSDRFDIVKARLKEGYNVETLELAIRGMGACPYVVNGQRVSEGKPGNRHDRLGIALGSGEQVEKFANIGYAATRRARSG